MAGDRPVPLPVVFAIRALATAANPLMPRNTAVDGSDLRPESLGRALAGVELGTWALGPATIAELVAIVGRDRPEVVLEFGSGSSTVALAWAMRESRGPGTRPRIISIEQDADQALRTADLLRRGGLEAEAAIVVAPLAEQVIEGQRTTCYALPDGVAEELADRRAGLVVIDGPAGPAGVRFGCLPLARPFVRPDTPFVLDDALRDGELGIARRWARLPYVRARGIRLIEKGLLVGTVSGP